MLFAGKILQKHLFEFDYFSVQINRFLWQNRKYLIDGQAEWDSLVEANKLFYFQKMPLKLISKRTLGSREFLWSLKQRDVFNYAD